MSMPDAVGMLDLSFSFELPSDVLDNWPLAIAIRGPLLHDWQRLVACWIKTCSFAGCSGMENILLDHECEFPECQKVYLPRQHGPAYRPRLIFAHVSQSLVSV